MPLVTGIFIVVIPTVLAMTAIGFIKVEEELLSYIVPAVDPATVTETRATQPAPLRTKDVAAKAGAVALPAKK